MLAYSVLLVKAKVFYFAAPCPGGNFFGFPHWWKYLNGVTDPIGKCSPAFNFPKDFLPVGLAIIDMLLYLAGIVAVASVVLAGIGYITASGNAEKGAEARRRIINALIGLVIVLVASAAVSFIGNSLS